MWRWLAIALLVAAPAWAVDQPLQNYIVPTAPVGTNNNQAASTAFVGSQITAQGRIKLAANTTFFASTSTGTDIPSCGLTTGARCASVNYLYNNILVPNYDTAGKAVTLSFDSNDSTCVSINTPWVGGGIVQIVGPGGSPPSIGLTCAGVAISINAPLPGFFGVSNMSMSGGNTGILCQSPNTVGYSNINFGAESFAHINVTGPGCKVACTGSYTISGGTGFHQVAQVPGSNAACQGVTVTLTGTPAFSLSYAGATVGGAVTDYGIIFVGSATGAKCFASVGGLIDTATGNPNNVFPGNSNCISQTGGLLN